MTRLALALALTSCTAVSAGLGASVTAIHNSQTDSANDWGYTVPVIVGMTVGAAVDVLLIYLAAKQWSKPMT